MKAHQQKVPDCPDCGAPAGSVHDVGCPRVAVSVPAAASPALPAPGDVIERPYDELALDKVAPEHQPPIVTEIAAPARSVGVPMPDPFDDHTIPTELRRKYDRP